MASLTIMYFLLPWYPLINPINAKNDQHLISPYSDTADSVIKIMRIQEMITNLRSFDCYTNSPCQYPTNWIEKSMENLETSVRLKRVHVICNVTQVKARNKIVDQDYFPRPYWLTLLTCQLNTEYKV